MPIGSVLQLVTRLDTKLGQIDAALATKASAPLDGGAFNPLLIDLSLGQVDYNAYTQTGAIACVLDPAKTPIPGGAVSVNIVGGGFAITFPGTFAPLEGLTSGTVLTNGQSYPFYFRYAPDWAGVGAHRVLVGAIGFQSGSAGPHAIQHVTSGTDKIRDATASLDGLATAAQIRSILVATPDIKIAAYTAVAGQAVRTDSTAAGFDVTMPASPGDGAIVAVEDTGTAWETFPVRLLTTDGAGFVLADGTVAPGASPDGLNLDGGNVAIFRRVAGNWSFVGQSGLLSGGGGGGVTDHGALTGLSDNDHPQYALAANPVFTGTVTVPDGALAIADVNGLQAALDAGRLAAVMIAVTSESQSLTTGLAKVAFRMPHAMTLTGVRASLNTAPAGSTVIVDITEGGTSILGTKLSIDVGERTSTTASSVATITDSTLADDAEIIINIDQIGSVAPGAGLKVTLLGMRT